MDNLGDGRSRRRPPAPVAVLWTLTLLLAPTPFALAEDEPANCWPGPPGSDPAKCTPDDPRYARRWEFLSTIPDAIDRDLMHPRERKLGSIGISLDRAWQRTTGRDDVVIAVLDSGIHWDYADLTRKVYLNAGELPLPEGATAHDANADGVFDILDYEADARVGDRNGNGLLDPEDLILAFSDCVDDDGNGYPDDISGYDLFAGDHCGVGPGDNDPRDDTEFGHGTGIAATAAAETNNGLRDAGVCPRCRVLPVRVGDSFVVDGNQFARGVVFAVRSGASVIASALGAYNNPPAARQAVDLAWKSGVTVVASAADEYSYHHNYPSLYNHTIYVNAIRGNAHTWSEASTFWGLNPCTNYGARVSVSVSAESCSSGATSRLAGVVGLIASKARDEGIDDLHAEEVYQLLRSTTDDLDNRRPDWGDLRFPARPGFDQFTGYGRINADRAVAAVEAGRIPPVVDLDNPRWFAVISPRERKLLPVTGLIRARRAGQATYWLEYALGVEPREADYHIVAGGTVIGEKRGLLGRLNFERLPVPGGPAPAGKKDRDRYSVTLRLRVTDDRGQVAETRRSFFVFDDPRHKAHFPIDLGVSGEAGPVLADLDGDGADEIVLPTADGLLRILRWSSAGVSELRIPLDREAPLGPEGSIASKAPRESVMRAAVIGDLHGDGRQVIVVASRAGAVYAFDRRGERLPGFPVRIPHGAAETATPERIVESGFLSRPVLADLDGKPGLEILVAGLDGSVHAWNRQGATHPGFPVALPIPGMPDGGERILSSPAVGDIDGDGKPEIVVGSNSVRSGVSVVFAVRGTGTAHPDGPLLRGWPVELTALQADLLPMLARGVSMDPALVDVDGDGDLEAIVYAVTSGEIVLIDHHRDSGPRVRTSYSMSPGATSGLKGVSFLAGTGSPLVVDTDADGTPELYAPLLSMRMLSLAANPGIPMDVPLALGGWELTGSTDVEPMLPGFPRRMEDLMILARPQALDVDGDGDLEVLMGSGGYLLHAFHRDGSEARGFPKFTGGWIFSAPAGGDLDGDGRLEIVAVTREGYLFAWETEVGVAAGHGVPSEGAQVPKSVSMTK